MSVTLCLTGRMLRLKGCKAKGTYGQLVLKGSKNRTKCRLQAI